jgi:peptidoglycan/xylan/chitin deacetylase (PgdA/CDA1 family)
MLRHLAYRVLNRSGGVAAWRRLRPPRGVIFMLHSVGQSPRAAFDPNARWRISAAQLETVIACARELSFVAVGMDEVRQRVDCADRDAPFFALTLDDGYADNLHDALPVCRRLRVPLTTYVTTGFVARSHTAWWHYLAHLVDGQRCVSVLLQGRRREWQCGTAQGKTTAFDQIAAVMTCERPEKIAEMLADLDARYGPAAREYAQALFLDEVALREYANDELVTIGAHGVSHGAMASLPAHEARQEMSQARTYLHDITGVRAQHLAYPFGTGATTGRRDYELAREAGFASAVTTRHGCLHGRHDALALPRIPVFPDDTKHSLRCKLSGLTTLAARLRPNR